MLRASFFVCRHKLFGTEIFGFILDTGQIICEKYQLLKMKGLTCCGPLFLFADINYLELRYSGFIADIPSGKKKPYTETIRPA